MWELPLNRHEVCWQWYFPFLDLISLCELSKLHLFYELQITGNALSKHFPAQRFVTVTEVKGEFKL